MYGQREILNRTSCKDKMFYRLCPNHRSISSHCVVVLRELGNCPIRIWKSQLLRCWRSCSRVLSLQRHFLIDILKKVVEKSCWLYHADYTNTRCWCGEKCQHCTKNRHSHKCNLGWWDAKSNCWLSPSSFHAQLELRTENWASLGARFWIKLWTLQEPHTVNTLELEIITLAIFSGILYWASLLLTGKKKKEIKVF